MGMSKTDFMRGIQCRKMLWLVIPCGRESIEVMCEAAGFLIEAPGMDSGDTIVIRKIS